jgi:predicted ester cyclase
MRNSAFEYVVEYAVLWMGPRIVPGDHIRTVEARKGRQRPAVEPKMSRERQVMSRETVERVREFFEIAFCENCMRTLQATHSDTHVSHLPSGDHYGPEGVRIDIAGYLEAFPDLRIVLEEIFDAGESVAYRFKATGTHLGAFLGFTPTGRMVHIEGLGIDRIENGKFIERWIQFDSFGLLQQLGLIGAESPA